MKKAVVLALAAIMVLGVAGAAFADIANYVGAGGPPLAASNSAAPVQVKATVNPRLTLTIETPAAAQTVDFGTADPGVPENANVLLDVKSNKAWTMSKTLGGDNALIGLSTTAPASMVVDGGSVAYGAKGEWSATDVYTIDVPWTTDPNPYTATVQYTVTQ